MTAGKLGLPKANCRLRVHGFLGGLTAAFVAFLTDRYPPPFQKLSGLGNSIANRQKGLIFKNERDKGWVIVEPKRFGEYKE